MTENGDTTRDLVKARVLPEVKEALIAYQLDNRRRSVSAAAEEAISAFLVDKGYLSSKPTQ